MAATPSLYGRLRDDWWFADCAHGEVAAGYPNPQEFVGVDIYAIHDDPAVGVLHDGIPALQGGQRRQGPHLRAQMVDLVTGPVHV
jgi:hypothetical protein